MDWLNLSRREKQILLTVFILVGLFAQWYGVNANSRYALTLSMVNESNFETNTYHWNMGDRSLYEDDYYSDKEPGMAFLATPVYTAWRIGYGFFGDTRINTYDRQDWFTVNNETLEYMNDPGNFYLSSLIITILSISTLSLSLLSVLIYRISGEFLTSEKKRIVLTSGFAFGTIVTHYGASFMPNAVVTLLSFSSFYIIYMKDELNYKEWILAGFLGGFGVIVDPTGAPVLVLTFFYALFKFKYISFLYVVGGFIGGLPLMIYNTALFGVPWMLPRFFLDPALYPHLQQTSSFIPELTQQGFRTEISEIFFASIRLLFYPYRGIFYWFPVLLLSFLGLRQLWKNNRKLFGIVTLVPLTTVLMVGAWWAWWMGGFFGARYLSVAIPFLMIPIFIASEKIDLRIIVLLVGISILVNLSGFHGYYEDQLKDLEDASHMVEDYQDDVQSFRVLENPVRDYYLEGLRENGPQSRILNGLYNRDFPPDIRGYTQYEERAPLPLLIWAIILPVLAIWNKEIRENLREHRHRVVDPK